MATSSRWFTVPNNKQKTPKTTPHRRHTPTVGFLYLLKNSTTYAKKCTPIRQNNTTFVPEIIFDIKAQKQI